MPEIPERSEKITQAPAAALKRIKRRFDRHLANRLIAFMAALLTVALAAVTLTSYEIIRQQSVLNVIANENNNLKVVNSDLELYFSELKSQAMPLNDYENFTNAVRNEAEDYDDRVYLEDYVSKLYYTRTDLDEVGLYILRDKRQYSISRFDVFGGVHTQTGVDESGEAWFPQVREPNSYYLVPAAKSGAGSGEFMTLYYAFAPVGDDKPIAVVSLLVNTARTDAMFSNILHTSGESVAYTMNGGTLFYTDDAARWEALRGSRGFSGLLGARGTGRFDLGAGAGRSLVLYDVSPALKGRLAAVIPYGDIYDSARRAASGSLLVGFGFLLLSVLGVALIARAITRPLQKLSKEMESFGAGDFDVSLEVQGHDEIAQVQRHFVSMARSIKSLISDRYLLKLAEKNAMLKALEAEVNPHFLYNALQTISTMALKSGAPQVSDMIGCLALSMRYCIGGSEMVTVSEEIGHIENYMTIQKGRFGQRLKVRYDLDALAGTTRIPRLSLQTLADNSIKHAMDRRAAGITIIIRTRAVPGWTVLCVSNDGVGMESGRFRAVLASLEAESDETGGKSMGLRNLNSRLRLNFGPASRLYLATSARGTRVCFAVPAAQGAPTAQSDPAPQG